jgi:hypothetical protein
MFAIYEDNFGFAVQAVLFVFGVVYEARRVSEARGVDYPFAV